MGEVMFNKEAAFKTALEFKKEALKEKEKQYNMMLSAAYSANERLYEIDRQHTAIGAKLVTAALNGGNIEELKAISKSLSAEKEEILKRAEVKKISYDCLLCNDTGYVGSKLCDCVKRLASGIMTAELSRMMPLEASGFDNFNLNYYSDKDNGEGNPRRRMTAIFKVCNEYALGFNPQKSHNLLFLGSAGLGKTHLTLAIVSALLDKGFVPIYGSAENLFRQIEKEKFGSEDNGAYDAMIECDLLVIDDLGAEMATAFTKSALYNLVNSRILSGKPTIINTNLSMKEIETRYTARISSRLIGNFDAYKFIGEDIRQQKAVERLNSQK